ncbi:PIG-L family deacetylase [Maliponia aquimaris]|uniref:GlcNAc-PI de-N-acetylase n=1 Tax=Maliponia aquimaris TaxID=1673631 RepID=A0A238KGF7_9RHOB|nr:PIG-L family deacetylase [Maliponia aquimaris]SMX41850.1 GlcNAc-PI de-N-acetylase [Maliponia aquimaris]
MLQPVIDGLFTGPLRIDVALRFDGLGGGSRPLVALGEAGGPVQLSFGQAGSSNDLAFSLSQGGSTYRLVAQDALQAGETAHFSALIDDTGQMSILKDDVLLAERAAEVPLGLGTADLRGAVLPGDAELIDLTVAALSPVEAGGAMAIVAHPDDDLLFMNPTVAESISAGEAQTTVYLTAGDAGQDAAYWEMREAGAKAAYAQMAGADPADWIDETVTLDVGGVPCEVASSYLESAPQVRLYFLRTPDGIDGGGTDTYGLASLEQLWDGTIPEVVTVDGAASYTSTELTQVLAAIMERHAPEDLLLQDDGFDQEHSDHVHATDFAEAALPLYGGDLTVTRFQGYDVWGEEENLSEAEVALVTGVFETYAAFDPAVTDDSGALKPPYTDWVLREYVAERYSVVDGERVDTPDPETPGPDIPDPVDPDPEDPGPEDPPPQDPGPEDPGPEDPTPEDPGPEEPPVVDPIPSTPDIWSGNVFGAGGVFGNLMAGSFWGWGGVTPPPTGPVDPGPTDPGPVDPGPSDPPPGPVSVADPFGPGGLFERMMLDDAGKWALLDEDPAEDDLMDDPLLA